MPVQEQVESLLQGRIHAAFSTSLNLPRGLSGHRLADDALACCVHAGHRLADRQRIKIASLADETFVMFARDTTAAGHELVMQLCVAAGFYPKVRYYVRQWLSALAMVSQGFGVALVPASMAKAGLPEVRFIALDDPRGLLSSFLLWNPEAVTPALERLIAHMTEPPRKAGARRQFTA
jgi:DNA-binding transcriptional LysR family regulator